MVHMKLMWVTEGSQRVGVGGGGDFHGQGRSLRLGKQTRGRRTRVSPHPAHGIGRGKGGWQHFFLTVSL